MNALSEGKITEGHTRPLLMLADRKEEQTVLFKEILYKKITVRQAEILARRVAIDRVRKKELLPDPEILKLEGEFQERLGTRVHIDRLPHGGQITIDFFSTEDLHAILDAMTKAGVVKSADMLEDFIKTKDLAAAPADPGEIPERPPVEKAADEESKLYDISNFSI